MPRLVIDDREIEVPEGTKVIDAAEMLGIMIPRFCYHKALGAVGACRMCAVKFLQGPFKGVQMSCMIDAKDGMVVSTTDEEAVQFRKWVIEWLMMNHPHDCPVCDEGGQCLLQDETVSGGHGRRRYLGKKRTYRDQYLGPYIQHEMNRCIHCYRCSRFYQEYTGYRDLGPMQIGDRVYFGRFADGDLESPFSGNLVDVCPTGVYTDKTARFKVRRWQLERAPSLCIQCSLGCNTVGNAFYRAIMRVEGRHNPAVNGYFICDACRFGFSYTNGGATHDQRPWSARVDGKEVPMQAAVSRAGELLAELAAKYGPQAIAAVGSDRNSLETQTMLKRICRSNKWRDPVFFLNRASGRKVRNAVRRLDGRLAVSMSEIESADFIMVVGADPLNEAGMSAIALRQAARKNARVVVIDPRPVCMPFEFEHIQAAPDQIEPLLGMLIRNSIPEKDSNKLQQKAKKFWQDLPAKLETRGLQGRIKSLSDQLKVSKKPVIVCGTGIVRASTPDFAADCALLLGQTKRECGIFYILPGANSFSSGLLSGTEGQAFTNILDAIDAGAVRALVVVENDLLRCFHDRKRLEQVLSALELLVVIDYLPAELVERASIFCPSSTVFETPSTFINQEGRVQFAQKVHNGGKPIWGGHPPHVFRDFIPGGDHIPAWKILREFAAKSEEVKPGSNSPGDFMGLEHPALERFGGRYPIDGERVIPAQSELDFSSAQVTGKKPGKVQGLELIMTDWMFGTSEFSAYSDSIRDSIPEPVLSMHPKDAAKAGLSDGNMVFLELENGSVEVKLLVSERMAEGVLVLPRHRWLDWQKIKSFPVRVSPEKITRAPDSK